MKKQNIRALAPALAMGLAAALTLPAAHAAGDAEAGKEKAAVCQACHGADGKATQPIYPNLAGQHASYLEQALADYKSGKRKNAIMAGFAAALSEEDMANLAAYYASMPSLFVKIDVKDIKRN